MKVVNIRLQKTFSLSPSPRCYRAGFVHARTTSTSSRRNSLRKWQSRTFLLTLRFPGQANCDRRETVGTVVHYHPSFPSLVADIDEVFSRFLKGLSVNHAGTVGYHCLRPYRNAHVLFHFCESKCESGRRHRPLQRAQLHGLPVQVRQSPRAVQCTIGSLGSGTLSVCRSNRVYCRKQSCTSRLSSRSSLSPLNPVLTGVRVQGYFKVGTPEHRL